MENQMSDRPTDAEMLLVKTAVESWCRIFLPMTLDSEDNDPSMALSVLTSITVSLFMNMTDRFELDAHESAELFGQYIMTATEKTGGECTKLIRERRQNAKRSMDKGDDQITDDIRKAADDLLAKFAPEGRAN
jgi:hypothetical protein